MGLRLGKRWLKGVLHVHTRKSDGRLSFKEAVDFYRRNGYDFISITDHNVVSKGEGSIQLLKGVEVSVGQNGADRKYHIVLVGVRDELPEKISSAQELIDWALKDGCFVFIAHPYWSMLSMNDLEALHGYHAIEVYNALAEVETSRSRSDAYWDFLLHRGRRVNGVASDDVHHYSVDALKGWVWVSVEDDSGDKILEALKRGHYYSSTGPVIRKIAYSGGELLIESSKVTEIRVYGRGNRGFYFSLRNGKVEYSPFVKDVDIELTTNGLRVAALLHGGAEFEYRDEKGAVTAIFRRPSRLLKGYMRVEVLDENKQSAWTNPIFF